MGSLAWQKKPKEMAWLPPRAISATSCAQKGHSLCFQHKLRERHEVPPRTSRTKVALQWAEPRWGWAPMRVCGTHPLLTGSASRATQSTEPHGLMSVLHLGWQVAISDPKCFLHIVDTQRWNPAGASSNLRHTRQFVGAFGVNWVTPFWLLTPEVIKKAILWGHYISYQLFYGINSSWEHLGWETHSPAASCRAAFWQHWRCWAGVYSIWVYLLWKKISDGYLKLAFRSVCDVAGLKPCPTSMWWLIFVKNLCW